MKKTRALLPAFVGTFVLSSTENRFRSACTSRSWFESAGLMRESWEHFLERKCVPGNKKL
jgi:hypothetical protein